MQQYSLFIDGNTKPSNTLMVREGDGAMRPAKRAEILASRGYGSLKSTSVSWAMIDAFINAKIIAS